MSNDDCATTWPRVRGLKIHTQATLVLREHARSVVLVHGLGVSADYMRPTLARLASDFRVWAPTLPGFGQSDKPTKALDIAELADMLAEWCKVVGIDRAVFLGNSLGCQVIIDLAVRYPALVDAVVLVGPTVDSSARTMLQQLWHGVRDLIHEPWSLWRILLHDYVRTGTWRMYRTFRFALQDPVAEKSQGISVPTLIVRGTLDTIAPSAGLKNLHF